MNGIEQIENIIKIPTIVIHSLNPVKTFENSLIINDDARR